eukprot:752418-Hanusia_phi.AAC.2
MPLYSSSNLAFVLLRALSSSASCSLLSGIPSTSDAFQGPVGEYNAKTGLPMDASAWLFKPAGLDGRTSVLGVGSDVGIPLSAHHPRDHPDALPEDPPGRRPCRSLLLTRLQPAQSNDPAQQQTQQILKFLPFMSTLLPPSRLLILHPILLFPPALSPLTAPSVGWFALNVPAGLGVYWVFNNVISTGQQWYIRQQFKVTNITLLSLSSLSSLPPTHPPSSASLPSSTPFHHSPHHSFSPILPSSPSLTFFCLPLPPPPTSSLSAPSSQSADLGTRTCSRLPPWTLCRPRTSRSRR